MSFPIVRREDSEYLPLITCEKCKEHTRHAKGDKVAWTLTDTNAGGLISTEFRRASGMNRGTITYRTAWECGECGTERVWGV